MLLDKEMVEMAEILADLECVMGTAAAEKEFVAVMSHEKEGEELSKTLATFERLKNRREKG